MVKRSNGDSSVDVVFDESQQAINSNSFMEGSLLA